jgi:hypothetical protein
LGREHQLGALRGIRRVSQNKDTARGTHGNPKSGHDPEDLLKQDHGCIGGLEKGAHGFVLGQASYGIE